MEDRDAQQYQEDGAQPNEELVEADDDGANNGRGRAQWFGGYNKKWILIGVGALALGVILAGGMSIYYLYRKVYKQSNELSNLTLQLKTVSAQLKTVSTQRNVSTLPESRVGHSKELSYLTEQLKVLSTHQNRIDKRLETAVKEVAKTKARLETAVKEVAKTKTDVVNVHQKIVNTQKFIAEMAQRQKWPWPFNNRIRGLEEEFGLPKSK